MPSWKTTFLLVLLLAGTFASPAAAGSPLVLDGNRGSVSVGTHLEYLVDPEGRLSIGEVSAPPVSEAFRRSHGNMLNLGLTSAVVWARFTVLNASSGQAAWLLENRIPVVEKVDLYLPAGAGGFDHRQEDMNAPFSEKEFAHRNFVSRLTLEPHEPLTFYMRFESRHAILVALTLWTPSAFERHAFHEQAFLGLLVGIILALIVYNLLLFFSLRDWNYLYFVLFLLTFGLNQTALIGLARQYLWPDLPWWAGRAIPLFAALSLCFGWMFTRNFLQTRRYTPGMDRAIRVAIVLTLGAGFWSFADLLQGNILVNVTYMMSLVLLSVTAVLCWRRGYRPARFFLLAWAMFVLGGLVWGVGVLGFLEMNIFTQYSFVISFCLGGILLSLAIGDRLHTLRRRYEQDFENVQDVIFSMDRDLRITRISPSVEAVLGYRPEEVTRQPFTRLNILAPEDLRQALRDLERVFSGEPVRRAEYPCLARDGGRRHAEITFAPSRANGRVGSVICVARDVTDRKRMEAELKKHREHLEERVEERTAELQSINEKLKQEIDRRLRMEQELGKVQKLESLGILAGGIAHDFNNLLTGVVSSISIARAFGKLDGDIDRALRDAQEVSLRARNLTQQLLTFAKGGVPVKETVSLQDLIRESVAFALSGSNVDCDVSVPDDLWLAEVDEGQITQVLHNIVINADQAMPAGGTLAVRVENVTVRAEDLLPLQAGDYVRIAVADRGVGIPEEDVHRIFDPFFTTKHKGSGLGLATSFSIVKKHGGHIHVESTPGRGTTVSVYLPGTPDAVSSPKEPARRLVEGRGKILLIDDDRHIRTSAGFILKRLGYEVAFACDGKEGVERFQGAIASEQPFDLVIADLTIPGGMGGLETLRRLKEIDPGARVMVASGYANDRVLSNYRAHGFSGMVTKPYRIEDLTAKVHQIIAGGQGSPGERLESASS